MALVPFSTVHCSRHSSCNLDLRSSGHTQGPCVGLIYLQLSQLSSKEIQLFTHHDIVNQYRNRLTAVVDRCVYISYNLHHAVPKSFFCFCSGRDSCMLTSRCMLPWLRSAPYPALCPCEPLRPVGDLQAVSYGARSIQYNPLLPASKLQPRSTVGRPHSGPICWVDIYKLSQLQKKYSYSPTMTS